MSRDELQDLEKPLISFPRSQGLRLFVTIRDGKVQVPDAQKAADGLKRQEAGDSSPDQQAEPAIAAAAVAKELPVVRHDTSPEPKLLVVTSAGEWTDADLARLDVVLKTWIETECPDRKKLEELGPRGSPLAAVRSDEILAGPDHGRHPGRELQEHLVRVAGPSPGARISLSLAARDRRNARLGVARRMG